VTQEEQIQIWRENMAYLITGGTGFLGSYVVRDFLREGKEVICLQRSGITPGFREVVGEDNVNRAKIIQADISDTLRLFDVVKEHKIDVIVHLAAILAGNGSESEPAYALRVNCVGTNNVLEAVRLFGLRRVVWTSSAQVFGPVSEYYKRIIGGDDAIYMPDIMYGAHKALDEFMSRHYFRKFGVDSICLRMGFTVGWGKMHGRNGSFSKFLRDAATDVPVTIAAVNADQVRGFGYGENTADLILKACEAPITETRTFNAMEFQCSVRQIVKAICKVNPNAKVTIKNGVSPEEATVPGTAEPIVDITGVQTELGWKPKYGLEEALKRYMNYFRQQKGMPLL
jgi:UDP-glucose 4-epimerase